MALLDSEIAALKYELGFNVMDVGAEPYIGVAAVFEQVIQPYTTSGASTTSSTSVLASPSPAVVTLTLTSATGFSAGDAVIVDVDSLQERATIRSKSGSSITLLLSLAHSGTYPVTVEGGESLIRGILQKLKQLHGVSVGASGSGGALGVAAASSGIKKVDEIEFFGGGGGLGSGISQIDQLKKLINYWRDELASVLGIERLNGAGSGSTLSIY